MNDLHKRIIEISKKHKLSHVGSSLTSVNIIDEIYKIKKEDEPFILSCGHSGLALYVINEKYYNIDAQTAYLHHGSHPDRCEECKLDCSTGSLGNGLPIGIGMALADRTKNVYCLISDGESAEGSIWEAIRVLREQNLTNLKVYLNWNGWGAYRDQRYPFPEDFDGVIKERVTNCDYLPFLKGQIGHYKVMNEKEHKEALEVLK